jgi:hypothetical protein
MIKMDLIQTVGPYLIPVATFLAGYLGGKRKSKAEADISELEATGKAIAIWRQLAQDFEKKFNELQAHVNKLEIENEKLYERIYELEKNTK